jgi:hypothetical protein
VKNFEHLSPLQRAIVDGWLQGHAYGYAYGFTGLLWWLLAVAMESP